MKDLATVTDFNIFSVLESAVQKGMDADALTKLVDLQERIAKNEAEQAYSTAMSKAQEEMPAIAKTKENKQTNSMYADLGDVVKAAKPIYTKHGFSLSFSEGKSDIDGYIKIECICKHAHGHQEPFFVNLPADSSGIKGTVNKTMIHALGSTFTYGKRYLIGMIFNIPLEGEDDDGQTAGKTEYEAKLRKEGYDAGLKKGTDCGHAWIKHVDVIMNVKDRLADNDLVAAAEYLYSLSNKEIASINLAPSKGGIFTLEETKKMSKSNAEWMEAIKKGMELNPDVDRSL